MPQNNISDINTNDKRKCRKLVIIFRAQIQVQKINNILSSKVNETRQSTELNIFMLYTKDNSVIAQHILKYSVGKCAYHKNRFRKSSTENEHKRQVIKSRRFITQVNYLMGLPFNCELVYNGVFRTACEEMWQYVPLRIVAFNYSCNYSCSVWHVDPCQRISVSTNGINLVTFQSKIILSIIWLTASLFHWTAKHREWD